MFDVGDAEGVCAHLTSLDEGLILNGDALQFIEQFRVMGGIEMAANMAKRALLKNRIKGIEGAIRDIAQFAPKDLTEEEMEEIYFRECIINPRLPKCLIRKGQRVEGVSNSYSFGPGTRGTALGGNIADNGGASDSSHSNGDRNDPPIAPVVELPKVSSLGSNNFASTPPPPASYTGKGTGNDPGGGGGSPTNVSPPGNGGANDGGEDRIPASTGSVDADYNRGGAGWGGYNPGGGGNRPTQAAPGANPFAKLFGKKKGKDSAELLDFRNPASKAASGRNIFRRLSNRYESVMKKKRLLEYEKKPKQ